MVLFSTIAQFNKREPADLVILPFWEKGGKAKEAAVLNDFGKVLKPILDTKDFNGKEGEQLLSYTEEKKEKRLLLLGLGSDEKITVETLRRSYGAAIKLCQKKKLKKINLVLPTIAGLRNIDAEACLKGICEGVLSVNYRWSQKSKKEESELIEEIALIGIIPKAIEEVESHLLIAEGVYFARDLINGNADDVTPSFLAQSAKKISERFPAVKTTVLNKRELEKEKMGLILAVSRGSPQDPALIVMQYHGSPRSKDKTALVGKGVTYDTGGLSLKPTSSMETMRDDMSGGAAVLAIMATAASMKLPVNIIGVIPTTENSIDGNSYKVGDVYKSYNGKSVEIKDTDAEGRLILADALGYTVKNFAPTRIIDLATLTGSVVVALGDSLAGLFSNDDKLSNELLEASYATNELLWRMPLHQPYRELIKSDIADLKNVGGRQGGSILAALFLEEFVEGTPWAHLDIAGPAFASKEQGYLPKNGVGFGVRLLIDFLQEL